MAIRRFRTPDLAAREVRAIRALMDAAFGPDDFSDDDWAHALGGVHVVLDVEGRIVAHASVVERELRAAGRPIRTGYVEAVATDPAEQGKGYGTRVMAEIGSIIRDGYELGALDTDAFHFYERLGWRRWRGPLFVRTPGGEVRTHDEEGYVLVLGARSSPTLDLDAPLSCGWRKGDVW